MYCPNFSFDALLWLACDQTSSKVHGLVFLTKAKYCLWINSEERKINDRNNTTHYKWRRYTYTAIVTPLAGVNTITPLMLHNDLRDPCNHDFLPNADLNHLSPYVFFLLVLSCCCCFSKWNLWTRRFSHIWRKSISFVMGKFIKAYENVRLMLVFLLYVLKKLDVKI